MGIEVFEAIPGNIEDVLVDLGTEIKSAIQMTDDHISRTELTYPSAKTPG